MNKFFSKVKRMASAVTESKKLKEWQNKLDVAQERYGDERNAMRKYTDYYNGSRTVSQSANSNIAPTKLATNVRNIVYELIESQVDSSIPMPKVRAIHEDDAELAKKIERLLENKIKTCGFVSLNDGMERVVPTVGADYFYVQWDTNKGLHSEVGDLKITEVHPRKLVPQPGVINFDDMDYFFVQEVMTKKNVKRIYGVSVEDAENDQVEAVYGIKDASTNPDIVTVNTAFYRNDHGGIGCYIWCDRHELLDIEDYQSRQLDHCAKCGTVMQNGVCPQCGGKKVKKMPEDYEEMIEGIEVRMDGNSPRYVDPFTEEVEKDEDGNPVYQQDENGNMLIDPITGQPSLSIKKIRKKIPYYTPNMYPIVLRKNVSRNDQLMGSSDTEVIIDQQDTIKKLGTKINEKLLKGGSYVVLPKGIDVEKTDKELKIIRVDNAAQAGLIQTINVQPNTNMDENFLEINYAWAKSTLGITDAYQGRFQASETSGTARQYAINQAAGRLESKRTMKNEAYAKLYELMFKFWLAYSDQTTEISFTDPSGAQQYAQLNRKDFLKLDSSGNFYWDDEFIFETDPTSTLMANRESMWNQADMKLQSGAFGSVGDLETARLYWTVQKANGYPNAGMALNMIEQRINEQKEQAAQMQQMQEMQEGAAQDEMPEMPDGGSYPLE